MRSHILNKKINIGVLISGLLFVGTGFSEFKINSAAFNNNGVMPSQFALCKKSSINGLALSNDISPPISWAEAPQNTKSYVLIVEDQDIPISQDINLPGTLIPSGVERVTGYHWLLANIPSNVSELPEGIGSTEFVVNGKKTGLTVYGLTGMNDYTKVFKSQIGASLIQMLGVSGYEEEEHKTYGGYDGPCPPYNDTLPHHYLFTLYAMNVSHLKLSENGLFNAQELLGAMSGHVLAKTSMTINYSDAPKHNSTEN